MASKPPSWEHIRKAAIEFASEWKGENRERAEAQSFWNDWFEVFGIKRRRVAQFEAAAKRLSTGGTGAIDVLWPGHIAVEHKSGGKDLEAALEQAVDYLLSLKEEQWPKLVIACDFDRFIVQDLDADDRWEFSLEDFPLEIERFGFLAGYQRREFEEEPETNIAAAELMADLFEALDDGVYPRHDLRLVMTRLLFLLFGDDTGIWERGLFQEFVLNRTVEDGSDLGAQLTALFAVLDQEESNRPAALPTDLASFPYINGNLFEERLETPFFTEEARTKLLKCCHFDWGAISPAVFGSMFQSVMTAEERRHIGGHYTSESNILKVIHPLFLDEYREKFEKASNSAQALTNLRKELSGLRFLDPACGCGNFLIVAYRELRRLEFDILVRTRDLKEQGAQQALDVASLTLLNIGQFAGIELEEFPARVAEVAMYLIDHLENRRLSLEFGDQVLRFPIETSATILVNNACRMDWDEAMNRTECTHLLGNPPFVGMAMMDENQQADRRIAFEELEEQTSTDLKGRRTGRLDYVASWYAKAFLYMKGTAMRAAFVSTNSITQGDQARTMGPLLETLDFQIDFAHRSFRWTSEARGKAVVIVVVVGFSQGGKRKKKLLFDYPEELDHAVETVATEINWYLTDGPTIYPAKRTRPLRKGLPKGSKGSQPTDGGHLLVSPDEIAEVRADETAARFLRPFLQTRELLYGDQRHCLWLVDASPSDLVSSPLLRARLSRVRASRLKSRTASVREAADTPALFTQIRQPSGQYLAFPEVSSEKRRYVPAAYLDPETIAGNKLIVFPDADLWLFGMLQSRLFMVWLWTMAGRLKSDPSFSPDLTYCTFPFPDPAKGREKIQGAAQGVLDARSDHPEASLADLYHPVAMPASLTKAHRTLDRAVESAFTRKRFSGDGERLAFLLSKYESLAEEGKDGV